METFWASTIGQITMCVAVCYQYNNRIVIAHFAQEGALLPIKKQNGLITFVPWGRRKKEKGVLPLGGWASSESIRQGQWDKYFPKPVKLPIIKFLEQDIEGEWNWFDIISSHWMQGLFIQEQEEKRVYVVTITPQISEATYQRWPKLIS